jgi:hypothetical protein
MSTHVYAKIKIYELSDSENLDTLKIHQGDLKINIKTPYIWSFFEINFHLRHMIVLIHQLLKWIYNFSDDLSWYRIKTFIFTHKSTKKIVNHDILECSVIWEHFLLNKVNSLLSDMMKSLNTLIYFFTWVFSLKLYLIMIIWSIFLQGY